MSRLLQGLCDIAQHRGGALSRVGLALRTALELEVGPTVKPPSAEVLTEQAMNTSHVTVAEAKPPSAEDLAEQDKSMRRVSAVQPSGEGPVDSPPRSEVRPVEVPLVQPDEVLMQVDVGHVQEGVPCVERSVEVPLAYQQGHTVDVSQIMARAADDAAVAFRRGVGRADVACRLRDALEQAGVGEDERMEMITDMFMEVIDKAGVDEDEAAKIITDLLMEVTDATPGADAPA